MTEGSASLLAFQQTLQNSLPPAVIASPAPAVTMDVVQQSSRPSAPILPSSPPSVNFNFVLPQKRSNSTTQASTATPQTSTPTAGASSPSESMTAIPQTRRSNTSVQYPSSATPRPK
eukprot:2786954-Rhodomonas_salina.1